MTRKEKIYLTLLISLVLFCITLITVALTACAMALLVGVIWDGSAGTMTPTKVVAIMALVSVIVGLLVSFAISKVPMYPMRKIITHLDRLESGDYKSEFAFGWPLNKHPAFVSLSNSLNKLAEELDSTEMLRSDFINNFSHEFKTPIVSIRGFARLLQGGDLTDDRMQEYIDVIEMESARLANLATNVMNMTRVENMAILKDLGTFNLSEQIRSCILLFENKWEDKNINMDVDFGEYEIRANKDLLREVWINLIDNAIKFSPPGGTVRFRINNYSLPDREHDEGMIAVTISNNGPAIPEDIMSKIFNRFYQSDESHASEGHGIGLPIVRRIAELHYGRVIVKSTDEVTKFTIILPD